MLRQQTIPSRYSFTRYEDGATIADVPFGTVTETHGAPYYLVHRADLHIALLDAAKEAGVKVQSKTRIVDYDFDQPSATADDGRVFTADLIVAADGVKSLARPLLTGIVDKPRDTGDVAYRISLEGSRLREDPELNSLLDDPCITCWCGPEAHIIGYPVRNGELYNVVICATSHNETTEDAWVTEGKNEELRKRFSAWEPRVKKLCDMTESFLKSHLEASRVRQCLLGRRKGGNEIQGVCSLRILGGDGLARTAPRSRGVKDDDVFAGDERIELVLTVNGLSASCPPLQV